MVVSFTDDNKPIQPRFPLDFDFDGGFTFKQCTLRLLQEAIGKAVGHDSTRFGSKLDYEATYRCFWCDEEYDPCDYQGSSCPMESEFQKVLGVMEWWNELPHSEGTSFPLFCFEEAAMVAVPRLVSGFDCLFCSKQASCRHLANMPRMRRDLRKVKKVMIRCNELSTGAVRSKLDELAQSSISAWRVAMEPHLFRYVLSGDDLNITELTDILDRCRRQMRSFQVLSSEPTRGALTRLQTLGNSLAVTALKRRVQSMLHSYLTRPGNPPHLLLAALNDIGNYELGIEQRTLLALSVWKAQCIGFCLVGGHAEHDCDDPTDWMAYKLELCHSNAITIVVAAVESFLYPRVSYKIVSSVATRRDAGTLGWVIAAAF